MPPNITGLSAGIVSHREFCIRKWYYAHPLWYYHRPGTTDEISRGGRFYQLVDPDLREICHLLHENGVRTTPSCQGHFYPKDRFDHVWEELVRQAPLIRKNGLEVRDSETDEPLLFRDASYRLPWTEFEHFFEEANSHPHKGYLGVIVPPASSDMGRRLAEDAFRTEHAHIEPEPDLGEILGGEVFSIHVEPESPEGRDAAWKAVTAYLRGMLQGAGVAG